VQDDHANQPPSFFNQSGSLSVVNTMPLPPAEPMFARLLSLAFENGLVTQAMLREKVSMQDVLSVALKNQERMIEVYLGVMMMEGEFAKKFVAKLDLARMAADITLAVEIDTDAAARLYQVTELDTGFFSEHMSMENIYGIVMVNLIKGDSPANRTCAARLCEEMVEYQAFGVQHETERQIMKAIGIDILTGDKIPAALRWRMFNAVYRGGQNSRGEKPMYAHIFDRSLGGVTFEELAEHLSIGLMVRPFGAYADRVGVVRTNVVKESEWPRGTEPFAKVESSPSPFQPPLPQPSRRWAFLCDLIHLS